MNMAKNDPNYIKWLLTMNDRAVERAIVAIYNRQTADEKSSQNTTHSNGVGFSGADASLGSYYAKWILSGRNLTGNHLSKARMMSQKYVRQLVEIATARIQAEETFQKEEREAIQAESA
jgi:hypothetical protein